MYLQCEHEKRKKQPFNFDTWVNFVPKVTFSFKTFCVQLFFAAVCFWCFVLRVEYPTPNKFLRLWHLHVLLCKMHQWRQAGRLRAGRHEEKTKGNVTQNRELRIDGWHCKQKSEAESHSRSWGITAWRQTKEEKNLTAQARTNDISDPQEW